MSGRGKFIETGSELMVPEGERRTEWLLMGPMFLSGMMRMF